ncbi:head completion protein [Salicola phage SCTP-2]|nr:head completion protein [Salicola phage SCTP-2]
MSKVHWKSGRYIPNNKEKYIGREFPTYRSSWEHKFCQFCDEHPNIAFWACEAIAIPYKHPFTKQTKNYVPDFFVIYRDNKGRKKSELVEIKPLQESIPRLAKGKKQKEAVIINQAKWEAARVYCKKNNINFRIISENHIFSKTKHSKNVKNRKKKR